ncbi:hypothetical protein D3C76_447420 [compost metagenome]
MQQTLILQEGDRIKLEDGTEVLVLRVKGDRVSLKVLEVADEREQHEHWLPRMLRRAMPLAVRQR